MGNQETYVVSLNSTFSHGWRFGTYSFRGFASGARSDRLDVPTYFRETSFAGQTREGISMKQAINRLLVRLALLGVAIVMGAMAVVQAQRGLGSSTQTAEYDAVESDSAGAAASLATTSFSPIPVSDPPPPTESNSVYAAPEPVNVTAPRIPASTYPPVPAPDQYTTAPPPLNRPVASQAIPPLEYELPPIEPSAPAGYDEQPEAQDEPGRLPVQTAQAEVPEAPDMSQYDDSLEAVPQSLEPEPQLAVPNLPPLDSVNIPEAPFRSKSDPRDSGGYDSPPPVEPLANEYAQPDDVGTQPDALNGDASFRMDETDSRPRSLMTATRDALQNPKRNRQSGSNVLGTGQPGPEELEGLQTPSLSIRKSAPKEVQVGKPARLQVTVRNVGKIAAHDVAVRDEVPRGTRLIDTQPAAGTGEDGSILWQIGTIEPNQEVTVTLNVMPTEEGEIGSDATVSFQVAATASSIVTRPQLMLEHTGPQRVLVGKDVIFNIRLSNPGTGIATGVSLEEDVPEGLRHYDGRQLEYPVGTLKPGETRVLELKLTADKPGIVRNVVVATADSKISVQDEWQLEVVAPSLQVGIDGPRRRFLERKANYAITIANPGTAEAKQVEISARLPQSMKYVNSNNSGQYDSSRHTVTWNLAALPPQEMGTVELTLMPIQMGTFPIRVDAKAAMGLSDSRTHDVEIEGIAALLFTVTDVNDPVETGGETTYEVHVVNQGSKTATNLRIAALVPRGMEPLRADGPSRVSIQGQKVLFDPLARLAPQGDTIYRIYVRGTQPGDKRIQVQMASDEITQPVLKEESTFVYSDE
jgi:uncharacterized repeat protein (TIGR01451 family)